LFFLHHQTFPDILQNRDYGFLWSFYDYFRETWTQNGHIGMDKFVVP